MPHRFVQDYVGDNQWGVLRARYRALGLDWTSELGATPRKTAPGSDFDTFFQPDGDVVVSGTSGNVSMRSLLLGQHLGLRRGPGGLALRLSWRYRQDTSRFQVGDKLVTHTQPASRVTSREQSRETTHSRVHELELGAARQWSLGPSWRLRSEAAASPAVVASLTTILPDKYPGQELAFRAAAFGLSLRTGLAYARGGLVLEGYGDYRRTWSYARSRQFRRETWGAGLRLGFERQRPTR